ncbi:MAG TPA: glycoside hydrolase family 20 zincin-like fold domain-containing protein [Terriglobia bacterium]|nr:glycoside hydrolase family 20 zincin-like fold domain-containing protein [Terriglobia bacterium]
MGLVLLQKNDLDGAQQQFCKALELKPAYPQALNSLGLTLGRKGNAMEIASSSVLCVLHGQKKCLAAMFCLLSMAAPASAATASPLFARGYTVIPQPQKVTLTGKDFAFDSSWRLELAPGVQPDDIAVLSLQEELQERFHLALTEAKGKGGSSLRLAIDPHAVEVGDATDKEKSVLAEQAYRLKLTPSQVTITGNRPTGLFYGVQTLVQLLKSQQGKTWLPEAEIVDWPDLELRVIYWDDAHHLEHLEVLKAALRQAAFYKINGFSIKLEGHFQYRHAPAMVEPYAMSPAELQELTDYALKYHVELIPYLDGPAHDAFILKHPEYAGLREYPKSNYEFCVTNPGTYELFEGMFEDLLEATKGSKYFLLSTDEPYYVGLAKNGQCDEVDRAKELGSVGKLLAEFVTKTAGYLHDHGRRVIFWGEYPMVPDDIASLPSYLINGEVYGPKFDPVFKAHSIRQMVYTSTEGEEQLFPEYYPLPSSERLHPRPAGEGRVEEMTDLISFTSHAPLSSVQPAAPKADQADLMGVFVAGWADPGVHPEAFWLGYATGPARGWRADSPSAEELMNSFYPLFYGPGATEMGRLYQLMSQQARFWEDSWETGPSNARTPIFGNSEGVFNPPHFAHDQYLPLVPVPSPELLRLPYDWKMENQKRLELAGRFLAQNDELLNLINTNVEKVQFNHYNLEVYLSIAHLYRQNLIMLRELGRIVDALSAAQTYAGQNNAARAVAALDRALSIAENIRQARNQALIDASATWYESWYPRVPEANGRKFLDNVDDVKDHQPVRSVDMSYLVYRELLYPLGTWAAQVAAIRNQYAQAHQLPTRSETLNWKDTSSGISTGRTPDEEED